MRAVTNPGGTPRNLRLWQPGQSGNPSGYGGRFVEMQRIARDATPEAMRVLIELLGDEDRRLRLLAATALLDRAWGRPKERRDPPPLPAQRPDLSGLTDDELEALEAAGAVLERARGEGRVVEISEPEPDPD